MHAPLRFLLFLGRLPWFLFRGGIGLVFGLVVLLLAGRDEVGERSLCVSRWCGSLVAMLFGGRGEDVRGSTEARLLLLLSLLLLTTGRDRRRRRGSGGTAQQALHVYACCTYPLLLLLFSLRRLLRRRQWWCSDRSSGGLSSSPCCLQAAWRKRFEARAEAQVASVRVAAAVVAAAVAWQGLQQEAQAMAGRLARDVAAVRHRAVKSCPCCCHARWHAA